MSDNTFVFDFIVVGAGACGAVVASRLASMTACKILLVEAGRDNRAGEMPAEMASRNPMALWGDKSWVWDLDVQRTPAQQARAYPAGKCVGGGSSVNGMGWIHAQSADFDDWSSEFECAGWGWEERMKKIHDRIESDPLHVGSSGPIVVSRTDPDTEWGTVSTAMKRAAMDDLGFQWSPDLNSVGSTGVSPFPLNWNPDTKQRSSVNEVYLEAARANANVTVLPNAPVRRIVCDEECGSPRWCCAELADGRRYFATREVLVCAGAVFTPALLQRSGIGPRSLLESLDIECKVENRHIGMTLQDHPVINGVIRLKEPADSKLKHEANNSDTRHANCLARFSSGALEADAGFNDLYFVSVDAANDPRVLSAAAEPLGFVDVMLMHCDSRGSVALTPESRDNPSRPPCVRLNLLSSPEDRKRMRFGVKTLAKLLKSGHFDEIAAECGKLGRREDGTLKTPDEILVMEDTALDEWMLVNASDGIHVSCSCAMGKAVDHRGKIIGADGIRVCDASIMPTVPRANTHVTSIAIAEAMADFIVQDMEKESLPLVRPLRIFGREIRELVAGWLFSEWETEIRQQGQGIGSPDALARTLVEEMQVDGGSKSTADITFVAIDSPQHVVATARLAAKDLESHDNMYSPWLAAVYVPTEERKKGYGRLAVQAVLDCARARCEESIYLWFPVSKEHTLTPFYDSLGFQEIERAVNKSSSFGDDIIIMQKHL